MRTGTPLIQHPIGTRIPTSMRPARCGPELARSRMRSPELDTLQLRPARCGPELVFSFSKAIRFDSASIRPARCGPELIIAADEKRRLGWLQ